MRRLALAIAIGFAAGPVAAQTERLGDPTFEAPSLTDGVDWLQPQDEPAGPEPQAVVLRALDKITARFTDITAPLGEPVRFSTLEILPRTCNKRPPEETPETTAFLEIYDYGVEGYRAPAAAEIVEEDLSAATAPAAPEAVEEDVPSAEPATDIVVDSELVADNVSEPVAPPAPVVSPLDKKQLFMGWMFASSPALNPLEHPVYDVWVIDCIMAAPETDAGIE